MKWWRGAREYLPDVPVLLLANKIDLPPQISCAEAMDVAAAWHIPFSNPRAPPAQGCLNSKPWRAVRGKKTQATPAAK